MKRIYDSEREARNAGIRRLYKRKKALIEEFKKRGCQVCGEEDLRCLDLHHRDQTTKNPRLKVRNGTGSNSFTNLSWDDLASELAKCDVVCANCHRKIPRGQSVPLYGTSTVGDPFQMRINVG